MSIKNSVLLIFASIVLSVCSVSCGPIEKGDYSKGSTTIYCDEGFKNILEEEIQVFEYHYPEASIIPYYVSEVEAIDALLENKTSSIIVTREMTQEQKDYIKAKHRLVVKSHCIAVDAVALITNKENPISQLSMDDIKHILNGRILNWRQVGWDNSDTIKIVFDNPGSSTLKFMKDKFIGENGSFPKNAYAQKTNGQVFDIVKNDKDALGIISVSWLASDLKTAREIPIEKRVNNLKNGSDTISTVLTDDVKILKVSKPDELEGFKPYQVYINSGEYPLYRKVYMINTGSNATLTHGFYSFVTGFIGQKIISQTGIMPYHVHTRLVELK